MLSLFFMTVFYYLYLFTFGCELIHYLHQTKARKCSISFLHGNTVIKQQVKFTAHLLKDKNIIWTAGCYSKSCFVLFSRVHIFIVSILCYKGKAGVKSKSDEWTKQRIHTSQMQSSKVRKGGQVFKDFQFQRCTQNYRVLF